MNIQTTPSTIKLNLPSRILQNAQEESRRIGISLQDFIRMLMATYFANAGAIRAVSRNQALFDRAQQEIQKGEYTSVSNKTTLNTYLDGLDSYSHGVTFYQII